jgi:hypothetical protein
MDFCLLIYIKTDVILYIWVHACVIWNTKTINITKKINSLNFMCTLTSGVSVMVFNVTFNNISVISWRYVLLHLMSSVLDTVSWIVIVLAHWYNSQPVDMLLHSDTLLRFRANQSLLLLLNAACYSEEGTIPIS